MTQKIEKIGTTQDLIDQEKIAQGKVALTSEGRPYSVAAAELNRMIQRRNEIVPQYAKLAEQTKASLEEIVRVAARIDQIVYELSLS